MFYTYNQNNSFGKFKGKYDLISIEADSPEEADIIALRETEIYFAQDCPCCGSRWSQANDYYCYEFPSDYGDKDIRKDSYKKFSLRKEMKTLVIYKNGNKEEY